MQIVFPPTAGIRPFSHFAPAHRKGGRTAGYRSTRTSVRYIVLLTTILRAVLQSFRLISAIFYSFASCDSYAHLHTRRFPAHPTASSLGLVHAVITVR